MTYSCGNPSNTDIFKKNCVQRCNVLFEINYTSKIKLTLQQVMKPDSLLYCYNYYKIDGLTGAQDDLLDGNSHSDFSFNDKKYISINKN